MKRTTFLCAAGLTLLLLGGCAQPESQMGYVGAEAAKQKALEAASLTASEVSFISTDMGTRNGLDYYQIRFQAGGQTYQYDVDALTGVVISAPGADQSDPTPSEALPPASPSIVPGGQLPAEPAPSGSLVTDADTFDQNPAQTPTTQAPAATAPQMTDAVSTPTTTQSPVVQPPATAAPSTGSQSRGYIGEAEAKRAALAHAGLNTSQISLIRAILDFDDGRWVYDVEFFTPGGKEYDYEIDAYTGAVISYDYDAEYVYPQGGSGSGSISESSAIISSGRISSVSSGNSMGSGSSSGYSQLLITGSSRRKVRHATREKTTAIAAVIKVRLSSFFLLIGRCLIVSVIKSESCFCIFIS